MPNAAAIIVAAGSGSRAGFDKLLAPLAGKPVLTRSIEAFLQTPQITLIVVVTTQDRFAACVPHNPRCPVLRADGGAERHLSVANGLALIPDSFSLVAVHDGARPLIDPAHIQRCLEAALSLRAVSSAHPIVDTLKRCTPDGVICGSVERDNLWAMETPQVMNLALLREAYAKILAENLPVTDEVSAIQSINHPVHVIPNSTPNPKITLPGDLEAACSFLPQQA